MFQKYDIIVVGGGHAGCEAAAAAAKQGSKTLLISQDLNALARLSCNPSIGGIAKGQIVREIDALGGYTGIVADKSMIQFRMLNRSKGPAMWSPRTQNDRVLYSIEWRNILEDIPNLILWRDEVIGIDVENEKITSVNTKLGLKIHADAVVITAGTFLDGKIYIGEHIVEGGRIGEPAAKGLTQELVEHGIETAKLKTGTPVRVDGRSIDFSVLVEQPGDETPEKFSYGDTEPLKEQRSCWLAYTNDEVHDILRTGFDLSPLFTGVIHGTGPRYCPSIEDKIERFSDKDKHQLFVEPEGWNTYEYYINGFSSSLPLNVQYEALKTIPGFENAIIMQPGYAIEYDYFPPTQLRADLMSKNIENLFFAGQVNGTTGYEEAAAQGLMAGINAHRKINNEDGFILGRADAYIGVLIDDLVTKGVDEPYRMFTSRAEYRLLLRQDNADIRLVKFAEKYNLLEKNRLIKVHGKQKFIEEASKYFNNTSIEPNDINDYLKTENSAEIKQKQRIINIILRPEISLKKLLTQLNVPEIIFSKENEEFLDTLEIELKYKNYIEREKDFAGKLEKFDNVKLPKDLDYFSFNNISYEAREKLQKIKPENLAQASRISGVSPADIAVILGTLKSN
ncbi:MAG: tRNA uridine-5-carboxymethylaminomethyl(34) synthesis enzyme MnmG [Bacteroidales bacterium]|nr:tRNA uridine-5-carboxymethylaminomethyl(34) synthesis enzyme MnmG [Bacteroidales bacterium]